MKKDMMNLSRMALLVFFLVLMPSLCLGERGKVVHLEDGDSGIVLYNGRKVEFRLYGIDAPESKQEYGIKAKSFSSKLMLRKTVEFDILDRDRYEREVALVFVDGKCVNEELVKEGLAWVYTHYCRREHCEAWLRLQQKAKEKQLGLWTAKNPVPPWEYRERHRPERSSFGWNLLTRVFSGYRGNESSHVFHRKGCKYYDCEGCIIAFSSREDAIRKGYTPCKVCRP